MSPKLAFAENALIVRPSAAVSISSDFLVIFGFFLSDSSVFRFFSDAILSVLVVGIAYRAISVPHCKDGGAREGRTAPNNSKSGQIGRIQEAIRVCRKQ